jgi:hypothetical protein
MKKVLATKNAKSDALPTVIDTKSPPAPPRFLFRPYQAPVFWDNESGILILHWSRQIGKSYTLANWAVARLIQKLETHPAWLITVLSNSRDNGAEFCLKAAQACTQANAAFETSDNSPDLT